MSFATMWQAAIQALRDSTPRVDPSKLGMALTVTLDPSGAPVEVPAAILGSNYNGEKTTNAVAGTITAGVETEAVGGDFLLVINTSADIVRVFFGATEAAIAAAGAVDNGFAIPAGTTSPLLKVTSDYWGWTSGLGGAGSAKLTPIWS